MAKKLFSQKYRHKQKHMSNMYHVTSESEPHFSNFVPIFSESKSESDYESDFNSVFMNLGICVFLSYIYTLLNKPVDGFFCLLSKQNQ